MCSDIAVESNIAVLWLLWSILMTGYPMMGLVDIVLNWFINCVFWKRVKSYLQIKLCRIFDRFLDVRNFKYHMSVSLGWVSVFQIGCGIRMFCGFLGDFREIGTYLSTHDGCHMLIFGSRRDTHTWKVTDHPNKVGNNAEINLLLQRAYSIMEEMTKLFGNITWQENTQSI